MAFNPVPDDVYPSATAAGKAIPLDVARPLGLYKLTASGVVTFPDDINLVSFFSTVDCVVGEASAVTVGSFTPNSFYAVANVNYDLILPKQTRIVLEGEEAGTVILNLLQKWQQMDNIGKYYNS